MSETLVLGQPHRPWLTWFVGCVLLGVLVSFWVVSDRRSDRERADVARCARDVGTAVDRTEKRLAALASYIAPAVDSSSYRTYEGLYSTLSTEAERSAPRVRSALDGCRSIKVWWVHRSVDGGRDAAVALAVAELARLAAITADGTSFHDGYDVIARLKQEAQRAL